MYVVGVISNGFPNCQDKRAVHIYHGSFVTENIVDYIFEGVIITIACCCHTHCCTVECGGL